MITHPLVIDVGQYSSNQFNQEDQQQAEEILWMKQFNKIRQKTSLHPDVSASDSSEQLSPELTNLRKIANTRDDSIKTSINCHCAASVASNTDGNTAQKKKTTRKLAKKWEVARCRMVY